MTPFQCVAISHPTVANLGHHSACRAVVPNGWHDARGIAERRGALFLVAVDAVVGCSEIIQVTHYRLMTPGAQPVSQLGHLNSFEEP